MLSVINSEKSVGWSEPTKGGSVSVPSVIRDKGTKTMKICILGATFKTANMGVSMLAAGAIRCLAQTFPEATLILCDYARKGEDFSIDVDGRWVRIRFLNIRFSKKVHLANNVALLILLAAMYRIVPSKTFRRCLERQNAFLNEILGADLFVSIAYGDSFSDIYGLGRLLYIVLPLFLVLIGGKKLVLLPQTIGPFRSFLGSVIAKAILKRAKIVYSRDQLGLATTRKLLQLKENNCKLQFCHDLAFAVDAVAPAQIDVEGLPAFEKLDSVLVGLNVSGLLMAGGYTQNNMFDLGVSYSKLVYDLIDFFVTQKSARVLLVPHVLAAANDLESDSRACENVFEAVKGKYEGWIGLTRGSYEYNEIKHVIGQCDFFVGARMHACIGALSQHIPTVPIAYSDKFVGVMESIGMRDLVVDLRSMKEREIFAVVERVFEKRDAVRSELENVIPQVKQNISEAFRKLDAVVEQASCA
jgi:colanic acid/amylovoran biosynthesis protein